MNVFDLVATLKLDADGFYSALEQAGKAILAFTKEAVETGAAFDQAMSKVEAISGATYDEMEMLRKKALQSSGQTKFTAEETADALMYMGMAGWKAAEMMEGLDAVMNLAAAGGEDVGRTSDIITDALTAFRKPASEAGHLADVLAVAMANSNTNIHMLGESFKYAAPLAGALGYSFEDTALALGLMANAGIKAGRAGRAVNNFLTRLANPTDKAEAALTQLGLSMSDAEGNMYSFREIMVNLRKTIGTVEGGFNTYRVANYLSDTYTGLAKSLGKSKDFKTLISNIQFGDYDLMESLDMIQEFLGEENFGWEDQVNFLKNSGYFTESQLEKILSLVESLGGKQALPALLAIIGASEEEFNDLAKALDNATGATEEMAYTMLDNLSGDITILRSNLDLLRVSLSDRLSPTLRAITKSATTSIQRIREAYEKNGLNSALLTMIREAESFAQNFQVAILPTIRDVGNALIDTFTIMAHDPKIRGPIDEAISTVFGFVERFLGDNSDVIVEFSALGFRALLPVIRGYIRGISNVIREELPNIITVVKEELPLFILALKELLVEVYDLLGLKNSPIGGLISGWFEQMRGEVEGHKQLSAGLSAAMANAETFISGGGTSGNAVLNLAKNLKAIGVLFSGDDAQYFADAADKLEGLLTYKETRSGGAVAVIDEDKASEALDTVTQLQQLLQALDGYQANVNVAVTTTEPAKNNTLYTGIPLFDNLWDALVGTTHARSMFGGTILRGSTLFGYDTYGRPQYGGGEGAEAVVGVNSLDRMIAASVRGAFSGVSIHDSQPVTIQLVLDSGEIVSIVETEIARNVQWKAGGRA